MVGRLAGVHGQTGTGVMGGERSIPPVHQGRRAACAWALGVIFCMASAPAWTQPAATAPLVTVWIMPATPHRDAIQRGLEEGLRRAGVVPGRQVRLAAYEVMGEKTQVAELAARALAEQPRVIVAIGATPADVSRFTSEGLPVVLSVAPEGGADKTAGDAAGKPPRLAWVPDNRAGDGQTELMRALLPEARRVGVIYDSGNPASVAQIKQLQASLPKAAMVLVEAPISRVVDVAAAARNMIERADLLLIIEDPLVKAALPAVARVADAARLPVLADHRAAVYKGAAVAREVDYQEIGVHAGQAVVRALRGASLAGAGAQAARRGTVYVNMEAARRQGVIVPEAVLKQATVVPER